MEIMKKNCKKCKQKRLKDTLGYVVNKEVFIATPPIVPTFWLPSEEEISKIEIGDVIKLIFINGVGAERMWVEVTKKLESNPIEWVGKLRNQAVTFDAKWDDTVRFSPKAIINYEYKTERI